MLKLNVQKLLSNGFTRDGEFFVRREKIIHDFTAEIKFNLELGMHFGNRRLNINRL